MVIVTGSVQVRPESVAEAIALSLEHVHRSRTEAGCISHAVHQDVEDPCRLFFFEQWSDRTALETHFAVPESGATVASLARLAVSRPELRIYDAQPDR